MKIIVKVGVIICVIILNVIFINPGKFDDNNLSVESLIKSAKSNEEDPGFEYWQKSTLCAVYMHPGYFDVIKCCTITFEYWNCTPDQFCWFPWDIKDCS